MTVTPQDIRDISPTGEFNSLSDAVIQTQIDLCTCLMQAVCETQCGKYTMRQLAIIYCAARDLAHSPATGNNNVMGTVREISLGPMKKTFGNSTASQMIASSSASFYDDQLNRILATQPFRGTAGWW